VAYSVLRGSILLSKETRSDAKTRDELPFLATDSFEDVQRHRLTVGAEPAVLFTTKLSPLQKKILRLLDLPQSAYDA
jgi:hypothetical protein